uniref:Uncharacterized protein n=1 Tax=Panagrolaimus sp. PS1159 TaxID=55785 RepID=A0AC35GVW6_9BILA
MCYEKSFSNARILKRFPQKNDAFIRMRPDKKAMRNSLVRFGKRAAETPNYPALLDDDTIQLENGAIIELGPFAYNDGLNLHRFYPQDFY